MCPPETVKLAIVNPEIPCALYHCDSESLTVYRTVIFTSLPYGCVPMGSIARVVLNFRIEKDTSTLSPV